ncbi:hypothetical protein [uncultured Cocleimonas sp.]|uniref:hypothetical protein n=1 Tax=uncultured Cocleimonas sp. TaxID=1051587 RepID=UPI002634CA1F|nr:hypothetical protein [uncultured Cocleimonas sp.]
MKLINILQLLMLALTMSFISSCSKKEEDNKSNETSKQLEISTKESSLPGQRALERWNALINKDWEKAYSYQSPNYRKAYSKEDFRNSFGQAVKWEKIKLLSTTNASESIADVNLELTVFFYDGDMKIPNSFTERWQKIDGIWWHFKK